VVVASLTIGGAVGVLLSAGFVWVEVGRYAAPQVPVSRFNEGKVLWAYTAGLFVGVAIAVSYVLFVASLANGALPGAALFLAGLVVGTEVAQILMTRSRYWGAGPPVPFYLVSFRAGVGGILALAAVASYLGGSGGLTGVGLAATGATAAALVVLEVAGGLLSFRASVPGSAQVGGPLAGGLFCAVAFFLLGLGPIAGPAGSIGAPLVVLVGAFFAYRGRRAVLAAVPAPSAGPTPPVDRTLAYGRTDQLPSDERDRPLGPG
jgi:hypothetical protein